MKFWLGVLATLLVFAPREVAGTTRYETFTETIYIEKEIDEPPTQSSQSIQESERQGFCLWEFMRQRDIDITLHNVIVSGEWTDIRGGACYLIGEDDEPLAQIYTEKPS